MLDTNLGIKGVTVKTYLLAGIGMCIGKLMPKLGQLVAKKILHVEDYTAPPDTSKSVLLGALTMSMANVYSNLHPKLTSK